MIISSELTADLSGVAFAGGGTAGVAKRHVGGQGLGAETLFSRMQGTMRRVFVLNARPKVQPVKTNHRW